MREALIKKRFGIPALLLITILLTAGTIAAYLVATFQFTITIKEPLSFTNTDDDLDITYQGESGNIVVEASNASESTSYGIFVNNTIENGQVESVSYSTDHLYASEPDNGDFGNDNDMVDAKYNIGPDNSFDIVVTIDTADNVAPDNIEVTLNFHREHKYEE